MPTFKHPCPYCDKFIDRAVAACPSAASVDPFAPEALPELPQDHRGPGLGRLPLVRRVVDRMTVVTTRRRRGPTPPPAEGPAGQRRSRRCRSSLAAPRPTGSATATDRLAGPQPAGKCSGCGAPLPAGARFCTICGTVAG